MPLSAIRILTVAVGAIGFEVVCLLLFFAAMFTLAEVFSIERGTYGLRAAGAVATLGLCALTGGTAVFVAVPIGRRWLGGKLQGAVFIVAVFNGFTIYFALVLVNLLNEFLWNVPFPLGGRNDFR